MSASTGTIRRPLGRGSIFGTVAMGAAALLAVAAIGWGAMSLTAKHQTTTQVQAPALFDEGSRTWLAPKAAPAPLAAGLAGRSGYLSAAAAAARNLSGTTTKQSTPIYYLPGNQVAVPGYLPAVHGRGQHPS